MSKYADEGTIAHILAAMCLTEGTDAAAYVGRLLESEDYEHAKLSPSSAKRWITCPGSHALIQANAPDFEPRYFTMEVTEDMAEHVQVYVDMVRERVEARKLAGAESVELLVEQSLPTDHLTGEENATGTGDVVIVSVWADGTAMLDLIDLKFGKGVEVEVEGNDQLLMYGSGALRNLELLYDFTRACLTVHQPRIKHEPSDWEIDISVLREFEARAIEGAKTVHVAMKFFDNWRNGPDYSYLVPGNHCNSTFCDARAVCPKLRDEVVATVWGGEAATPDDFENLDADPAGALPLNMEMAQEAEGADAFLAACMSKVDLIEGWCKAVRAEVERRLLSGGEVPGYKLVQGKKGNRKWKDETEAEKTFKSMRLKHDEMYNYSVISPTAAEKLLKDTPKRWSRVQELITQSDGSPTVAAVSDKRPALVITPVEEDFEVLIDDLAG